MEMFEWLRLNNFLLKDNTNPGKGVLYCPFVFYLTGCLPAISPILTKKQRSVKISAVCLDKKNRLLYNY